MAPHLQFPADGRLVEQRERHLAINVPVPISERVDALAELLYLEGYGAVARKEIVAALIHSATTDAGELAKLLTKYRRARVKDTHVGQPPSENVITFPARSPGPRSRSG